ncbi:MAG: hypothetical protein ACRDJ4_16580 [Actinomycetota bacterium]
MAVAMQLAEHVNGQGHMFGWYVGFAVAFAIIVVVVIVVAAILTLARRIEVQATQAIAALDEGRVNTLPLWDVQKVEQSARSILDGLQQARIALGG